MKHVTDEQLGKITRQQIELLHRIYEGYLDVEEVSKKIQNIIKESSTSHVSQVPHSSIDTGGESLALGG